MYKHGLQQIVRVGEERAMGAEDEIQDQKGIRGEFGRRPGHVRIIYKPFGEKVAENRVSEIVREAKTARRKVSATNTLVLGLDPCTRHTRSTPSF